ncbi:MAG: nitroreductase [Syntrophorhabdaceae bacterium]|nr:nitroreductase [Syntrophorhabdaceae bacterium]
MELLKVINERKSIRAFKPDEIPHQILENILAHSIKAPSAINLQPWEFYVVSGEEKARLSRRLLKSYKERQISCSPGNIKPLEEKFTKRGVASFELMNPYLEKLGLEFNRFINEGSCNFYGAPTAIIICLDNSFSKARLVDIGIILGFITLIACDYGLGTCPIGLISAYEDDIKEMLNIPDNKDVVIGMAIGYPDWTNPVNEFKTPRDTIDNFVKWIE